MTQKVPELSLIAHRMNIGCPGVSEYNQVDNSLEALSAIIDYCEKSKPKRLKGIELDVRLTKDNVLVAVHDPNLRTMTRSRVARAVSESTFKELREHKVVDSPIYYKVLDKRALLLPDNRRTRQIIQEKMKKECHIPGAHDLFEALARKEYKGEIVYEVKGDGNVWDASAELINEYKDRLNIVAKGYDEQGILRLGENTGVRIGLLDAIGILNKRPPLNAEYIRRMPFSFYSMLWSKVNPEILKPLVENDKELYIWTIDSAAHLHMVLKRLKSGLDSFNGIPAKVNLITNIPELLGEYLDSPEISSPYIKKVKTLYKEIYENR